jgi:hypothetical protein
VRCAALLLVLFAISGCGGKQPTVAGCLAAKGFLVQGTDVVQGTSGAGVSFTLTIYATTSAAKRAFAAGGEASAALIGRAVVDFSGNPPASPGAAPGRLSKSALATIGDCLRHP